MPNRPRQVTNAPDGTSFAWLAGSEFRTESTIPAGSETDQVAGMTQCGVHNPFGLAGSSRYSAPRLILSVIEAGDGKPYFVVMAPGLSTAGAMTEAVTVPVTA